MAERKPPKKVVRLEDLTTAQRRLVLALIEAAKTVPDTAHEQGRTAPGSRGH